MRTVHRTGGELYVACCGLRYSELARGDVHTADSGKVTCGLRKWRIEKVGNEYWELSNWQGPVYSARTFAGCVEGFVEMARSAAISLEILRSRLARSMPPADNVPNPQQRDTRNSHRFVPTLKSDLCYRCGGHKGNEVHEGFPVWPTSWGNIVQAAHEEVHGPGQMTGSFGPGITGVVSLTAPDGSASLAAIDEEGNFSIELP
jgi:hypothetical protein